MKTKFIEPTEDLIRVFIKNLREEDYQEVYAAKSPWESVEDSVRNGIKNSDYCRFAVYDGKPVAVYGIKQESLFSDKATIWFLSSYFIEDNPVRAAIDSRRHLRSMLKEYPRLENHVDLRYTKAVEWLKWLGFSFGEIIDLKTRTGEVVKFQHIKIGEA